MPTHNISYSLGCCFDRFYGLPDFHLITHLIQLFCIILSQVHTIKLTMLLRTSFTTITYLLSTLARPKNPQMPCVPKEGLSMNR